VVAGVYLPMRPSVYTTVHQPVRHSRREQKVIESHAFVHRPPFRQQRGDRSTNDETYPDGRQEKSASLHLKSREPQVFTKLLQHWTNTRP
jgi:hypothetical protein